MTGPQDTPRQPCARCGRPVAARHADWETFERMHWVCFHFEREHFAARPGDVDVDRPCGPGCPSSLVRSDGERDVVRDALTDQIEHALVDGPVPLHRLSRYEGPGVLVAETSAGAYVLTVVRRPSSDAP